MKTERSVERAVRRDATLRRLINEQGQSMVEFSLTILITLFLTFGMIEFGRVIYTASLLQWAAQAGARAAIVDPDSAGDAVRERMFGLDLVPLEVTVEQPAPDPVTNKVTVNLAYRFEFILPLVSSISGGDIELTASASMVAF